MYESILATQPEHPHALNFAGAAQAQMGNNRRAIELLRKAADVQPENPEAHRNLGIALRDQGRFQEAAHALGRVLEILPDLAEGHNDLGISSFATEKRFDKVSFFNFKQCFFTTLK